jgi:predicted signal transduction protein with EAL and GGDEF domain
MTVPAGIRSYSDVVTECGLMLAESRLSSALLLIELPGSAALNARLGFRQTAALLGLLSEALGAALGERGRLMRIGETCFVLHVNNIRNGGHAALAAEKVLRAADEVLAGASLQAQRAISIGITLYPQHGQEVEQLLRRAQLAATWARQHGRRHALYDESLSRDVLDLLELGEAYALALDSRALHVAYQPKLLIADGSVGGVEALLRWTNAGVPVAGPDKFIPLAENLGLMPETTWFALSNALRLSAENGALPVAVNVTPATLHDREFIDMVSTGMTNWNIPAGVLTLEVTEGALIADFDEATRVLNQLRDLGARISIDDFGTGYSSLSYFRKISADEIKIDKSFVLRMREEVADQRLVETIVNLARQFSLRSVAEGVEDVATLSLLGQMGCDYAQGYLFSPALDAETLQHWLAARVRSDSLSPPRGGYKVAQTANGGAAPLPRPAGGCRPASA